MKTMVIAGARPNFVKIAPILSALRARGHDAVLVHTGQHYDARMSDSFFSDLGIPEPDEHLGVGSGTHAEQTARIMSAFESVFLKHRPDWLVVVGDVNSTLACSLVAAKLKEETRCRIAHVEAGLRSGDWRMPEEVNRVLTDRLSDLLLTPSRDAHENLEREGIAPDTVVFVGNVMIDTLFAMRERAHKLDMPAQLKLTPGEYVVVTLHRPSNVDDRDVLIALLATLDRLSAEAPVVFPVHPRTRARIAEFGLQCGSGVRMLDPLGYVEMLSLTMAARLVLTDSGGLQEETTALGVPCITLREQTERPITVTEGTNRMAPWPLQTHTLLPFVESVLAADSDERQRPDGWDGQAADRIVSALENAVSSLISSGLVE